MRRKALRFSALLPADRRVLRGVDLAGWRLLIIGAGQLSRFLAQIALGMDYDVTVCANNAKRREHLKLFDVSDPLLEKLNFSLVILVLT